MKERPNFTVKQKLQLKFPFRAGSKETGYVAVIQGPTNRRTFFWDDEERLLVINQDMSNVGQHRALLQALVEWSLLHLEGGEYVFTALSGDEIDEFVDLFFEMMVKAGVHVVNDIDYRHDQNHPDLEYKKLLGCAETNTVKAFQNRGGSWKKHVSMISQRRRPRKLRDEKRQKRERETNQG